MNVVSFYAPREDHPFFRDYTPYLDRLELSCRKYGHKHYVLSDRQIPGFDCIIYDLPHNLMLAFIMAQRMYLESYHAETDTLLTGADCVLARDPVGIFADGEFDLACTTHPFDDSILNTGAIFVRGGSRVAQFWRQAEATNPTNWGDDQTSLRDALGATLDHGLYQRGSHKVRFLPLHPWNVAPENPGDPPGDAVLLHFRGPRKEWLEAYCASYLGIGDAPEIKTAPNVALEISARNTEANSRRGLSFLQRKEPNARDAVIVGGGPSLADQIELIRWRRNNGAVIFAVNGTARYLRDHGIIPDYFVTADQRPENERFVAGDPAAQYLIAGQCDPVVFDACPPSRTIQWHIGVDEIIGAVKQEGLHCFVGGGTTSGLCAICIAEIMGHRTLHLYGFDSSDREGKAHAYEQAETNAEKRRFTLWCDGREFVCSAAMYAQAMKFKDVAHELANNGVTLHIWGDGFLPHMAHSINRAAQQEIAA